LPSLVFFSHDELKIVNQFAPDRDRYKTCRGFFPFCDKFIPIHTQASDPSRAREREREGEKKEEIYRQPKFV